MSTYHTVDGQSYAVTAGASDATITDSSGLSRTVKAGTQESFLGDGGDVTVDGPHHFTQLKGPFGNGGGGGGGGQKITVDDYLDHTYTSLNPVQNRVLAYAIDSKQDKLTIDPAPVAGSANPVASGGVQSCLADKASLAGTNVFTDTNSFNGTVGGSGVKDYADGYAELLARTADLPSGTELSGVKYESGFMPKLYPQPYHMSYVTDMLFSGGEAVRADRIRLRVMRGKEAFAKPRHHYIVYGRINFTTSIAASDVAYKTVKPVSYYDTDWEEDGTKLVEFAATYKDAWWYPYYGNEAYYAVSNGTDPNDLTNVIKHPAQTSSKPAHGAVDWAAVYVGYTAPSTGPARVFMAPKNYRSIWGLSFFVETTGYKTTKDRIDNAAKKDEDNTFYSDNTFNHGVKLGDRSYTSYLECDTLNRVGHDIYWGSTKLNGGGGEGYAKLDESNVFNASNEFNGYAGFNGCTQFYFGADFRGQTTFRSCVFVRGSIDFYNDINVSDGHAIYIEPRYSDYCSNYLYNYAGDLYWGRDKVGDVASDGDNVFTGQNTFEAKTSFVDRADFGSAYVRNAIGFSAKPSTSSYYTLYRYNNDLYWGDTKLNGGGDVHLDSCNTFTATNTFERGIKVLGGTADFNCKTHFGSGICVFGDSRFECGKTCFSNNISVAGIYVDPNASKSKCNGTLTNQNGDLYWGTTKLNGGGGGGGDVYTDRNNVFAGSNTFNGDVNLGNRGYKVNSGLYNYNGDLYWGETKLNCQGGGGGEYASLCSDNVFYGDNTFDSDTTFNNGARFGDQGGQVGCSLLYKYNCDLYWGETKLNGGGGEGDVTAAGNNVFTGQNTFNNCTSFYGDNTYFYGSTTHFNHSVDFGSVAQFSDIGQELQGSVLYNRNGHLYWGTCKLNGQTVTVDTYPVMGSTNPVSSGGMYPTPVLVVQGGTAQFPARLRDNGIYVLWDNDLADRSAEIVIDPDTRPNEYSTAEIHIFNHTDTPVSIKWPASWHWRTPEGDYELDTEASQHVPVLKGNSCMCITVRCSVDRGTHFTPPPMTIVPFVMAEKAYEYTLSENTQQEG